MNPKRYALIGCGMMGKEHVNYINMLSGACVSYLYDLDKNNADELATIAKGAQVTESFEDIIARPDIDAIVIVSPNDCHADQLLQIAQTRTGQLMPVPILCEKPLFTNEDDLEKIKWVQDNYDAPVWVGMEYRYMPAAKFFIDNAESATGEVKTLTIVEHRGEFLEKFGEWNKHSVRTGGTAVEKCCHFFDLMRHIMGSDPVYVSAFGGQDCNFLGKSFNGVTSDIWDALHVNLLFADGRRAHLELCMYADGSRWNEQIWALGQKGKIECRIPGPHRFFEDQPPSEVEMNPNGAKNFIIEEFAVPADLAAAGDHHGSVMVQSWSSMKSFCN